MNLLTIFRPIQWIPLLWAVGIMAVLAIIFGTIIVLVSKYMAVQDEDERIKDVRFLLAGANCGACGKAGCDDFAKALCLGNAKLSDCAPTSSVNKEKIADLLEMDFSASASNKAIVHCLGGNKCKDKYEYHGYGDCVTQEMLSGGKKQCDSACLGSGTCVATCPVNAIHLEDGRSVINSDLCISCGACVSSCPKSVIQMIPNDAKVFIGCNNHSRGKAVSDFCEVGCIACTLCAKNCPENAITMVDNLPVIDYEKCTGCLTCVKVCPRKTIREL